MNGYPDNFDRAAFDRAYGTEAQDRECEVAAAEAAHDDALTIQLHRKLSDVATSIEAMDFIGSFPVDGHDADLVASIIRDLLPPLPRLPAHPPEPTAPEAADDSARFYNTTIPGPRTILVRLSDGDTSATAFRSEDETARLIEQLQRALDEARAYKARRFAIYHAGAIAQARAA